LIKAQAETDEAQEAVKTLESEQADLLVQLDEVTATAEAAAISTAQMTAERDTLLQTLSDTQHALELEQAKTDAAQVQLAELHSSFDQQAKELNVNLSKVATLEATAHSDKAEISRLQIELTATKDELKKVTTERNEIATDTAEVKGELKAIIAERNKLSGLNDQLTQTQAKLEAEHSVLNKQYSELSSRHLSKQEQVTLLQDQLKKAQDALILIQNKDNTLDAD